MCGIVGLFAKSSEIEERLGAHLAAMLVQMSSRGPDSAGVAVYRDPVPGGASKLTLYSPDPREVWVEVRDALRDAFGACEEPSVRASHAVLVVEADAIRLGLARALVKIDEGYRVRLRTEALLTRDARLGRTTGHRARVEVV